VTTSPARSTPKVVLLSYGEDPLKHLSSQIVNDNQAALPDLSAVVVVVPDYLSTGRLCRLLLQQAAHLSYNALLLPRIITLREFVAEQFSIAMPVIPSRSRELVLVEALLEYPSLLNNANPWALAESLLELFDELYAHHYEFPATADQFSQQMKNAYGCADENIGPLTVEANLVFTLWKAWLQQLEANATIDGFASYLSKLSQQANQIFSNTPCYFAGLFSLYPAEWEFISKVLRENDSARFYVQGNPQNKGLHPDTLVQRITDLLNTELVPLNNTNDCSNWLDLVFDREWNGLAQRAAQARSLYSADVVRNRLSICVVDTLEEEARLIELKVMQWIQQKKSRIGVVIENRQLARRVRALFERSQIKLKDYSGWALSTTAAASVLENWLQVIEEDFAYLPLLDLLKSPFRTPVEEVDNYLEIVFRFEQDIIRRENISRNMDHYKTALEQRKHKLNWVSPGNIEQLFVLLNEMHAAAQPLVDLLHLEKTPFDFISCFIASLKKLQVYDKLMQDAAGGVIIDHLHHLADSALDFNVKIDWLGFRSWLARSLESATFTVDEKLNQYVELIPMNQSSLYWCDALIIADVSREQFPGNGVSSVFFNNPVRAELGLTTAREKQLERFYLFRRLLQCSNEVLLSHHDGDENKLPSAWLEMLETFHQLAFSSTLYDRGLLTAIRQSSIDVSDQHIEASDLLRPRPSLPVACFPKKISASLHQQLINCPYAFFASAGLGLQATDEVRETLQKDEYGSLVHACLEAFHSGRKGLAGPFKQKLCEEKRSDAIALLEKISQQVFQPNIQHSILHKGWLYRWQKIIPAYIEWQIKRAKKWDVFATEEKVDKMLASGVVINGRIDRVDNNNGALAIVDYKTGSLPAQNDLLSGESVQLAHYATVYQKPVQQAELLGLDSVPVKNIGLGEADDFATICDGIVSRLERVVDEIKSGQSLPAWGDDKSCLHCLFKGLCRKGEW